MKRTGVENIRAAFDRAQAEGRAAFMPYQMLGHPTVERSPQIIEALAAAGADLFELGLPFSDPLADGPVIQAAAQQALDNGMTMARCLAMVAELRTQGMTGIYLDLDGYPEDEQQSALAALTEAAGCGPEDVIHSGSGLLCYIPLGQE